MIATSLTVERQQALKPLVEYFPLDSEQQIDAGEMVHDYYGVPVWLMKHYLLQLGAAPISDTLMQGQECWVEIFPAPPKHIGSLQLGGARVEFTGRAGSIQALLTRLEWMTLRA